MSPFDNTPCRSSSKKDEAIRRKVELELRRKTLARPATNETRPQSSHPNRTFFHHSQRLSSAVHPGTVAALRPEPALTVPHTITVTEAARLCAAKQTDCVLVVDDSSSLVGIFTAKDLVYRVVSKEVDPHTQPVSSIMTRSPLVTRDTMLATEALITMALRGFRHLPVCDTGGDIVGLLNIAKVCYEALEKIERAYNSNRQLHLALEGVRTEWGSNTIGSNSAMDECLTFLQDRMTGPSLDAILDASTAPCTVSVHTSVLEAAQTMAEFRTTSVLVLNGDPGQVGSTSHLSGIFTSKDVVLRVIAPGIDPATCSVARVMTPLPGTAPPSMDVHEAFRQMHNGHYLNLPVVDEVKGVVAVVNVLHLTWTALETISSMQGQPDQPPEAKKPGWNPFRNTKNSSVSLISPADRRLRKSSQHSARHSTERSTSNSLVERSSSSAFPRDSTSAAAFTRQSVATASTDPEHNSFDGVRMRQSYCSAANPTGPSTESEARVGGSPALLPQDDLCVFKFTASSQVTHRFRAPYFRLDVVREKVVQQLAGDRFFRTALGMDHHSPNSCDIRLGYEDDEGDRVAITTDSDMIEAVRLARQQGRNRVTLLLCGEASRSPHHHSTSSSVETANKSQKTIYKGPSRRSSAATSFSGDEHSPSTSVTSRASSAGTDGDPCGAGGLKHYGPPAVPPDKGRGMINIDMAFPVMGFLGVAVLVALACTRPRHPS